MELASECRTVNCSFESDRSFLDRCRSGQSCQHVAEGLTGKEKIHTVAPREVCITAGAHGGESPNRIERLLAVGAREKGPPELVVPTGLAMSRVKQTNRTFPGWRGRMGTPCRSARLGGMTASHCLLDLAKLLGFSRPSDGSYSCHCSRRLSPAHSVVGTRQRSISSTPPGSTAPHDQSESAAASRRRCAFARVFLATR